MTTDDHESGEVRGSDGTEARSAPTLSDGLESLPLLRDDMYLRMQALNLSLVDKLLQGMEGQLLSEYHQHDRTPIPEATMVSALSQLWVFGLYELLRTWRQRAGAVLRFAEEVVGLEPEQQQARLAEQKERIYQLSSDPDHTETFQQRSFEQAVGDPDMRGALRAALDHSELSFRRLEALRVHLAKHEIPRRKGSYGMSPGYGRIDMETGCIYWEVPLGDREIEIISRRSLAGDCASLADDRPRPIVPAPVQRQIARMPTQSYGVKRVTLVVDDGQEFVAFVAWNKQIVGVVGGGPLPCEPGRVVAARHEPDSAE